MGVDPLKLTDLDAADLFGCLGDGLWLLDPEWRCVRANAAAARIVGHPLPPGALVWDAVPCLRGSEVERALLRAAESGQRVTLETRWPTPTSPGAGNTAHVELRVCPGVYPGVCPAQPPHAPGGVAVVWRDITADVIDRELARAREREFAGLSENSPDLIARFDRDLRHVYLNPAGERVSRLGRREALGRTSRELGMPEPAVSRWEARLRRVFDTATEEIFEYVQPRITPSGPPELVCYEARVVPERDPAGRTDTVLCVSRDITRLREIERALRASELEQRRLAEILEATPDMVSSALPDGRLLYVNRAGRRALGIPDDDDVRGRIIANGHPAWAADLIRDVAIPAALRDGSWTGETAVLDPAGREVPVSQVIVAHRNPDGSPAYLSTACRDISDRADARRRIEESEALFRATFEYAAAGIAQVSLDGHFLRTNRRFCEMLGYEQHELQALTFADVTHPDDIEDDLTRVAQLLSGTLDHYQMEKRYIRKGGEPFWVSLTAAVVRGGPGGLAGDPHYFIAAVVDISAHKAVEAELRAAKELAEQANAAKDRFLAQLSHELRTPLTPVLVAASSLEHRTDIPADVQSLVGTIRRNVETEARLIDDLLDLTRIARNKVRLDFETVDLHQVVRGALEVCRPELDRKKMRVQVRLLAARHHVHGDAGRLQQVVLNLLSNAAKFTPPGGTLEIETTDAPSAHPPAAASRIRLLVRDDGIGIEPNLLPTIFEPFVQGGNPTVRHAGGLGLGLAIVRSMVEAHGGTISASSAGPNTGATFEVHMTATGLPPSDPAPRTDAQPAGAAGASILLVEDDADTLKVMERLLTRSGYRVTTAASVASATAALTAERFDVVVSDLGLPDGSGLDVATALRQKHGPRTTGGPAAIALSGYGMEDDLRRSHDAGFDEHLTKPIRLDTLTRTLSKLLGR